MYSINTLILSKTLHLNHHTVVYFIFLINGLKSL